jgi:hypothetical protein
MGAMGIEAELFEKSSAGIHQWRAGVESVWGFALTA